MDSLINQFNKACKEGNLEQVKYLINNFDLDINIQDNFGDIGFHLACLKWDLAIVEYFKVDAFACGIKNTNLDINIQNNFGDIGFHYACSYGHLELVKNLIKKYFRY